tara:strand:- start:13352 stop:14242 length:891 start_codon:yes stop_codon:yes gene_type:complete
MNNSEKNEKKDDSVNIDINENVPLTNAEWSSQYEQILVEWADKAICYRWLHSTSQINYAFKNRWFTIPVIIMSTLTGTANFAQERIPEEYVAYYSVAVGSINILAGIITTIQQFLKISELNEAHRASSISWDKFYRNIKLELGKSRIERTPVYQMLKLSKEEFDRLMETSPPIEAKIIKTFKNTFSGGKIKDLNNPTEKQKKFLEIIKPEICDNIETTKNFVYTENLEDIKKRKTVTFIKDVIDNNDIQKKTSVVNNFINNFNREFKRQPTSIEIFDNLKENISHNIINEVINETK